MTPERAQTILRSLGEIQPEDREAIADMIEGTEAIEEQMPPELSSASAEAAAQPCETISPETVKAGLEAATPGPWRPAKAYRALVSNHPSGYDDDVSVQAYGGHMVCESVKAHNRPLIAMAPGLAAAYLALAEENKRLRKALRRHHDWHLSQDRDGRALGIDPVDAYSESGLREATVTASAAYLVPEGQGNE